jgi:excisionase family DNA binding protein
MENVNQQLLSLPALAEALRLPERWLKAEADAGRIPHLKIGKRYRFNRETVVGVLAQRAGQSGKAVRDGR